MKKIRSLIAIAMLSSVIVGAVADTAEARRGRGRRARGSRVNNFDVTYDFDLFTGNDTQDPIIPTSNLVDGINIYTFDDAITNFEGNFEDVDDAFELNEEFVQISDPLSWDLKARYLPIDTNITLLNGDTITPADSDFNIPFDSRTSSDRIEYIITSSALEDSDIDEFTLFIENTANFDLLDTEEERTKAITDIEYIVDSGLLELINGLRVSGEEDIGSDIVSTESFPNGETDVSFEPITSTVVPESNNVIGLFGLGFLGMGLLVKKKTLSSLNK